MVLEPSALAVDPGRLGSMKVHLTNSGPEAREVAVEVPAQDRDWSWVHPESCSVTPGDDVVVAVFFKPKCGPHPTAGTHTVDIVARAEGEAAALREDLDRIRVELPQAVAAARAEVTANLQERHAAELAGARATLQGEVARLEGELAGERSRSAAAQELVVAYRDQLGVRPPAARPTASKAARKRGTAATQA